MEKVTITTEKSMKRHFERNEYNDNPKTGKMARFAMEFPFQFLDFSIEISKDWNGNSKSKRAVIPGL